MSAASSRLIVGLCACAALAASCVDPVHQGAVDALGPEVGGVSPGEFHRAGQPCTVCHQDSGPANIRFTVGGTIFYGPGKWIGAANTKVEMIDSAGSNFVAVTNCVGNFFVTPDVWNPAFPILVQVQLPDGTVRKMHGQVGREGSCAGCHHDPAGSASPGISRSRRFVPR